MARYDTENDELRDRRAAAMVATLRKNSLTHSGKTVSLRQARFLIDRAKEIDEGLTSPGRSLKPEEIQKFLQKRRKRT
jgi:hypothetical protein